MARYRHL